MNWGEKVIIKNTRFNIMYPKVNDLRRKAFEIEDALQDYFLPVTLIPIPDDAPEEIPRISTTSKSGHSQLTISLNNTQLVTNYDNDFGRDWSKSLDYTYDRINNVCSSLENYVGKKYLFSGLTTEIIFDSISEPIQLLRNNFLKLKTNTTPHEIEQKTTFILNDYYYVNITFKNLIIFENNSKHGFGRFKEQKEQFLGCILDINDRHGFNSSDDYTSNYKNIDEIINITRSMLEGKLIKMIEERVFEA